MIDIYYNKVTGDITTKVAYAGTQGDNNQDSFCIRNLPDEIVGWELLVLVGQQTYRVDVARGGIPITKDYTVGRQVSVQLETPKEGGGVNRSNVLTYYLFPSLGYPKDPKIHDSKDIPFDRNHPDQGSVYDIVSAGSGGGGRGTVVALRTADGKVLDPDENGVVELPNYASGETEQELDERVKKLEASGIVTYEEI